MLRAALNAAGQDRQKLNMIIKKSAPVNRWTDLTDQLDWVNFSLNPTSDGERHIYPRQEVFKCKISYLQVKRGKISSRFRPSGAYPP